jgi:hypothetical protein
MQVTKQIHAIKIPFQIPVAPSETLDRFVYSYLIYDTEICLIDSGIKSSERVIFDYITNGRRFRIARNCSKPTHRKIICVTSEDP